MYFLEYLNTFFYLFCSLILLTFLVVFNLLLIFRTNYREKITSYECGFQSFEYAISNFDIKYYIIAVLFLLFDLELIFFLPFLMSLNFICLQGLISVLFFFILLIFGFLYEWKLQVLNFSEVFYLNKKIKIYYK